MAAWFGMFYVVFYLSDTVSNVPYYALGPELTENYEERSKVFFTAKLFYFVGMLFAAMAPPTLFTLLRSSSVTEMSCNILYNGTNLIEPPLESQTVCSSSIARVGGACWSTGKAWYEVSNPDILSSCGDNSTHTGVDVTQYGLSMLNATRYSYTGVACCFALFYVVACFNLVYRVKESTKGQDQIVVPLVPSILRAFKNIAFRPLLVGWMLDAVALTALATMFPFFIEYVIKPDGEKAQQLGMPMSVEICLGLSLTLTKP